MSANPFARDEEPGPSNGRFDQRDAAVARPDMRAAPRDEAEKSPADETLEEPGYGHGV